MEPMLRHPSPPPQWKYRRIGSGWCCSVWAPIAEGDEYIGYAFKREDGGTARSLRKDYDTHCHMITILREFVGIINPVAHPDDENTDISVRVFIPHCHRYMEPSSAEYWWWWEGAKTKFPRDFVRCATVQVERIPSLPVEVSELLIENYCPKSLVSRVIAGDPDSYCLIRPYLGRRRYHQLESADNESKSRFQAFSLRNFQLHLDQMEELGMHPLNITNYAVIMAESLAMIHWLGRMDGRNVEFVLAPPREGAKGDVCEVLGDHVVWLLDFDCCKSIHMNEQGVDQAVHAFFHNHPYYPRLHTSEQLWGVFRHVYLEVSARIFRHKWLGGEESDPRLPRIFMHKVTEKQLQDQEDMCENS